MERSRRRSSVAGAPTWALRLCCALAAVAAGTVQAAPVPTATPQWKTLASQPKSASGGNAVIEGCNLLTDGTVVCLETATNQWHRLKPDANGQYVTGTWDAPGFAVAPMPNGVDPRLQGLDTTKTPPVLTVFCDAANPCPYAPRFFASAVLYDGRMIVIGGEYLGSGGISQVNGAGSTRVQTNIGFVYDPTTNTWSAQLPETAFGSGNIGDAQSAVLANGRFILANINSGNVESYDPVANTFTVLNPINKMGRNDEEGWTNLPDGTILTVNANAAFSSEILDLEAVPSPLWSPRPMLVNLADIFNFAGSTRALTNEVGPAILRPDGRVVAFSGSEAGQNAIYDLATSTWLGSGSPGAPAGMDYPSSPGSQLSSPDAPAALLPNGDILVQASPVGRIDTVVCPNPQTIPPTPCGCLAVPPAVCDTYNAPSTLFRFKLDPATGTTPGTTLEPLVPQPQNAASITTFQGRMIVLPTGEILYTTQDFAGVGPQIYSGPEVPQDAWRPVIAQFPNQVIPGSTNNPIEGTLFTGLSQGAGYGDDTQSWTNYPLVRITNDASQHVRYARTHNHNRMGVVAVGNTDTTKTQFDAPADLELGASCLQVVVNGIASACQPVVVTNNRPPVARCKNFPVNANGLCSGIATVADIDNGTFDPDGDAITLKLNLPGPFGLGPTTVDLIATDTTGAVGRCSANVIVSDSTPPTLTAPPDQTIATCTEGLVHVGQATANDNCLLRLTVTGEVIARNGVALTPHIQVVDGSVALGVGTYTIRWTASDGATAPVTKDQTVTVGASLQASQSFLIDDRAKVLTSSGGFAAVLNSGTGQTLVGNDSQSGGIRSVGPVSVQHRASVAGSIVSAAKVNHETDSTVNGTITENGTVALPSLPSLPAFPAPNLGGFTVNSGVTQNRPAGSYSAATIVNGGTLILQAGDYFFQSLTINSGSIVRVTPATRIFVRDTLIFNAPLLVSSGTTVQPVFLGFAGTSTLSFNARFDGTLVAPNGTVRFGTNSGLTYTGSFFGRVLEVTPGSSLVCGVK